MYLFFEFDNLCMSIFRNYKFLKIKKAA